LRNYGIDLISDQELNQREGTEVSPLAKSKLRKKIKYRIVLIFFCVSVIWSCVIWPMVLKI